MKNNLFYYATSELSQDAFICWLTSFALEEAKDELLKECANDVLRHFVPELSDKTFVLQNVERQVRNVDVLLTLCLGEDTYKVIIEDKTYTSEHDNQLLRYLDDIQKLYPAARIRGVYYKTGFQNDLFAVHAAGYTIIDRQTILCILKPYAEQTNNQILRDYYEYWSEFQKETEQYGTLPVGRWTWKQINGFYEHLDKQETLQNMGLWCGYGYVANQTGGFYGLWTGCEQYQICVNDVLFDLYLQLEVYEGNPSDLQLCLKFCAKEDNISKDRLRSCRDQMVYDENWNYKLAEFGFAKPKRLGSGRHMTIGVYQHSVADAEQIKAALIEGVKAYKRLLDTK